MRLQTIFLGVAAVMVMICGVLLSRVATHPTKPLVMGGAVAVMLLLWAVLSYVSGREGK